VKAAHFHITDMPVEELAFHGLELDLGASDGDIL
jgi:hypothetical protein